jgi:hypothetical protein
MPAEATAANGDNHTDGEPFRPGNPSATPARLAALGRANRNHIAAMSASKNRIRSRKRNPAKAPPKIDHPAPASPLRSWTNMHNRKPAAIMERTRQFIQAPLSSGLIS